MDMLKQIRDYYKKSGQIVTGFVLDMAVESALENIQGGDLAGGPTGLPDKNSGGMLN